MPTERPVSFLQRMEIGDHVLSIALAGKIDEHFCPVNVPAGVREKLVELGVIPGDVGILHSGREIEAGNRAALAADNAGQRRPDLVHAGFRRMAHRTSAVENGLSRRGIAGGIGQPFSKTGRDSLRRNPIETR